MAHILVHSKVEDYAKWRSSFDSHKSFRSENGSKGGKVFQSANDPNDIFVLLEWDSFENLQTFSQSEDLKERMKDSGVVGIPDVFILKELSATAK